MNCLKQIIDIATDLRRDPRNADMAAQLEETAMGALDAIIFELGDRERQILDLRDELRKERLRRAIRGPRWSRLDELESTS